MDGSSLDTTQLLKDKLKDLIPEAFTEGKIDWEKLKAILGEDVNFSNERYVLNWAGKSDAFKVMQTPSTSTLVPVKEESEDFENTQHIFIEGENLETLKVLQKSYFGAVKMIYIDPPYNTGNDSFIYPDKFSETKEEYQKRIGDKDEEGYMTREGLFHKNSKENGQYHSNWLNMMYPRLFMAKNLLREDGVIFVSIDDNEVHNLRLAMNEIFGEENNLGTFLWKRRQNADSRNQSNISTDHEYLLAYSKRLDVSLLGKPIDESKYKNPDEDERGPWASIDLSGLATKDQRPNLHFDITDPSTGISYPPNPDRGWSKSVETIQKMILENRILFPKSPTGRPREKKFLKDLQTKTTGFSTWLDSKIVGFTTNGTKDVTTVMEGKYFDFPKPVKLLSHLIKQTCSNDDIALDFFSGSGTFAHSIFEVNSETRDQLKFICVQLPELCDPKSEAYKAGYQTIADISKERIRRAAKNVKEEIEKEIADLQSKIKDLKGQLPTDDNLSEIADLGSQIQQLQSQDLGFKVFKLSESNFKQWQPKPKDANELAEQMKLFVNPVNGTPTPEAMTFELLLKAGLNLNSSIETRQGFFLIDEDELAIILEKTTESVIDEIIAIRPKKVIALDAAFKDNDQLKTNTALQLKDAEIDFKTI